MPKEFSRLAYVLTEFQRQRKKMQLHLWSMPTCSLTLTLGKGNRANGALLQDYSRLPQSHTTDSHVYPYSLALGKSCIFLTTLDFRASCAGRILSKKEVFHAFMIVTYLGLHKVE